MPIALLQTKLLHSAIDAENGIISGVRVMEIGKLAQFEGDKKEVKRVKITSAHIDALLSHVGNRAIPMHLTHEWFEAQGKPNADSVEMAARIGALKSFRKDDAGNLIADAYLKSGQTREDTIWAAEHNPENNMFSAVFSYRKDDPLCIPTDFNAADLVPEGAAVTALFAKFNETTMDKNELIEALKDPEVAKALLALIPQPKPEDQTALLKKSVDDAVSAALKSHAPSLTEDQETALLKKAEANFVAKIGSGAFVKDFASKKDDSQLPFVARLAKHRAAGADNGLAILRAKNDAPEEYNAWEAAGRPMPTVAA